MACSLYWADQRPDARLSFYFNRRSRHLIEVSEIVTRMVDRTGADATLEQMVLDRVRELLDGPRPVYLILDREHLDHWTGGLPEIEEGFVTFINKVPFFGLAVLEDSNPDGTRKIMTATPPSSA